MATSPHDWGTVGARLRHRRKELRLTLRDVELASRAFAYSFDNEEFAISRTHLSQIETRDALPNIFRLFSISQIYKIDLLELMSWYGVVTVLRANAASSGSNNS